MLSSSLKPGPNNLPSKIEPELKDRLLQTLVEKNRAIDKLQKDDFHLHRENSNLERYFSKYCMIIRNLPLISGNNFIPSKLLLQNRSRFFFNLVHSLITINLFT